MCQCRVRVIAEAELGGDDVLGRRGIFGIQRWRWENWAPFRECITTTAQLHSLLGFNEQQDIGRGDIRALFRF